MSGNSISRRKFLGAIAATGAMATSAGASSFNILKSRSVQGRIIAPGSKMNVAIVGAGGKGFSDMESVAGVGENIMAICDVDDTYASKAYAKQPNAVKYHDFREMLDKEKTLDAVVVATPDHMHAPISLAAMERGLHVYCQKPLTHTVYEARAMAVSARRHGVVTQMGNQGVSQDGFRRAVEVVRSGAIGPVRDVHVWTNRPVWPQGIDQPLEAQEVPSTLKWDLWLGVAPMRNFNAGYTPFKWRGWWDYGTGALGDMACHTTNLAFMALNLTAPTSVEAEVEAGNLNPQTFPKRAKIRYNFPARGDMPPVTMHWYNGGNMPSKDFSYGREWSKSGLLLIGEKGTLFSPNDYGEQFVLLPEKDFTGYVDPAPTLPRVDGEHYKEWIDACKGGTTKPFSNFDYSGPMTEALLLGNIAMKVGHRIEWDTRRLVVTNSEDANRLVKSTYRESFKL